MPASLFLVADQCPACLGTLRVTDPDGALSGTVGQLVPCDCVSHLFGEVGRCPCHVTVWGENDGHTGWVVVPAEEFTDDGPFFRPCSTHAPVLALSLAVAA